MQLIISGQPIAKARHRLTTQGGFARQYDPQSKEKTEFTRKLWIQMNFRPAFDEAVEVELVFNMDAVKGTSKAESNLKQWQLQPHARKPDIDNLVKFTLDAGNGILWTDDRLITQITAKKLYSKNPCTIINIHPRFEGKMDASEQNVYKVFSVDDINDFESSLWDLYNRMPKHYFSENTLSKDELARSARSMIEFSNKWTDKLKKIRNK